jgi:hypothetical protein
VHSEDRLWNRAEWTFFLDHLRDDVLKLNGRFVMHYRKLIPGGGRLPTAQEAILLKEIWAERGGVGEKFVVFDPLR